MKYYDMLKYGSVSFVLAATLTAASSVVASVRHHGSFCAPPNASTVYTTGGGGLTNTSTTSLVAFTCPVVDNSALTHDAVTTLNIYVYQPTSSAASSAMACVTFGGSGGGTCGSPQNITTAGSVVFSPSKWAWGTYPSDYAYISMGLGPQASLMGYYIN